MTPNKLLDAMRALGYDVLYDPEHHPEGPTEEEIPDLLGRLAAMIDAAVSEHVKPGTDTMDKFRQGYMDHIPTRPDFFRTLMVRTATTGLLPDTAELHAVEGVSGFKDTLIVAAAGLHGATEPEI
ncbi:hypothetical protein [Glycomyces paridis]|uniref:Uncharacterized protein n=1 Tax=Glycomyces paridis TaxID=2126555 RepID=A0A4S8PGL2_9ACTN|nr:hypothetical protein [Glycomyces paridis]THV29657.1 hypothetical protein E9998_09240 [Glycomyces paridis]